MAGPTTLFQSGDHASRPAASAGCVIYWCSDHEKFYRSDGSAWADLADLSGLGGAGNILSVTRVYRATAQNVDGNGTLTSISFSNEIEDTDGAWAIGTPTQIVIPSALNGRRARFYGLMAWESAFAAGTYRGLYIIQNATGIGVSQYSTAGQTSLADRMQVRSEVVTLVTDDTYELQMRINTTGHGTAGGLHANEFGFYTID